MSFQWTTPSSVHDTNKKAYCRIDLAFVKCLGGLPKCNYFTLCFRLSFRISSHHTLKYNRVWAHLATNQQVIADAVYVALSVHPVTSCSLETLISGRIVAKSAMNCTFWIFRHLSTLRYISVPVYLSLNLCNNITRKSHCSTHCTE